MNFHVILVVSLPQIALVAQFTSIFSETFLAILFIVEHFHMTLIEDSPSEFHIANATHVSLFHVRFDMRRSRARGLK